MEHRCRQFNMAKVTRATEIRRSACYAAVRISEAVTGRHGGDTHMSCLYTGPRAGSYKPPRLGLFKSLRRAGFVICLTEIRRMSSVVRTEKDTLWTVEGMGNEIFITENPRIRHDDRYFQLSKPVFCLCKNGFRGLRAVVPTYHVIMGNHKSPIHPYIISSRSVYDTIRPCHFPAVRVPCPQLSSFFALPQPVLR
jgi:hypothetical protein